MSSSNNTDNVKHTKARTEFQNTTFFQQHASRKKASSMLGRGIGLTVGGIVLILIVFIWANYLGTKGASSQGSNIIPMVGLFLGVVFLVYGLTLLFKAAFGRKRSINCPYCGTHHTLVRSARTYICDECGNLLRFAGSETDLIKVTCPNCKLEWAASPNTGKTICHSCGAIATIANGATRFSLDTIACKSCSAANPDGSYFCWSCGTLLTPPLPVASLKSNDISESYSAEPNSDGMDIISIRVNTPVGQVFHGIEKINYAISKANESHEEESCFDYGAIVSLKDGLDSIENALDQNPEYTEVVSGLLSFVHPLLASLLKSFKHCALNNSDFAGLNKFWVILSANINRLMAKANSGVNLTQENLDLPNTLVVLKSGKPLNSTNPPLFEATITNEAELQTWVQAHLTAQPIKELTVPTAILKAQV